MAPVFALFQTVIILIFIDFWFQIRPTLADKVKLYRYWNPKVTDHFYTSSYDEVGDGGNEWNYEGIQCEIATVGTSGTSELYRYWNPSIGDHFYTTNFDELGDGNDDWTKEGSPGACYSTEFVSTYANFANMSSDEAGLVPLYRYWQSSIGDHFYTTYPSEIGTVTPGSIGSGEYVSEGIACFVYPYGAVDLGRKVQLHRYWNLNIGDHFYTTNYDELGDGNDDWDYEGVQCEVETLGSPGTSEIFRYWNPSIGDHFYTTYFSEVGNGNGGYTKEGSPGGCFSSQDARVGLVPLYRYWQESIGDHFYTTYPSEIGTVTPGSIGSGEYVSEGIACFVYPYGAVQVGQKLELHRYWNPRIADHFYTTNYDELGAGNDDWDYEGVQCEVETLGSPGTSEIFRYWNPSNGDHFYTIYFSEVGNGNSEYTKEASPGGCFSSQDARAGLVPLYRYWQETIGDHFYTTNAAEIGTTTPGETGNYGYVSEGIACYVYPASTSAAVHPLPFDEDNWSKSGWNDGYYIISFGNSSVFTFIVCAIGGLLIVNIIMMVYTYCYKSSTSAKVAYKKVYMDSDVTDV